MRGTGPAGTAARGVRGPLLPTPAAMHRDAPRGVGPVQPPGSRL